MNTISKAYRRTALAACLGGLLLAAAGSAQAEGTTACSALLPHSVQTDGASAAAITKSELLYRFQARPYMRVPEGVALWMRAPQGVTAADLHNALVDCAKQSETPDAPWCVPGAAISVERAGGHYRIRVTSPDRGTALEIQNRAPKR